MCRCLSYIAREIPEERRGVFLVEERCSVSTGQLLTGQKNIDTGFGN
jgi:hypothetical protein